MLYDDKKFIGQIIKNARIKANYTQAGLAEKIEMTEKNVNNIENGRQFPQVNNFLRIIEVLHIPIEEFGISIEKINNNFKIDLFNKILTSNDEMCQKYLKAINLVDEIL